jgi:hypothetical protein
LDIRVPFQAANDKRKTKENEQLRSARSVTLAKRVFRVNPSEPIGIASGRARASHGQEALMASTLQPVEGPYPGPASRRHLATVVLIILAVVAALVTYWWIYD